MLTEPSGGLLSVNLNVSYSATHTRLYLVPELSVSCMLTKPSGGWLSVNLRVSYSVRALRALQIQSLS